MIKRIRQQAIEWFAAFVIIVIFVPMCLYCLLCIGWLAIFWLAGFTSRIALEGFACGYSRGEGAYWYPDQLVRWISRKATEGRRV